MNWNSNWNNPTSIEVKPKEDEYLKGIQEKNTQFNIEPTTPINPTPSNPWDTWTQDQVLMHWNKLKEDLLQLKADEMEFRKYVVSRAFPEATEGTNTLELGGGYELKAVVKYNYKLSDNATVEAGLERIAKIGNMGPFVADRIVKWSADFVKSEYNKLLEDAENGSGEARAIMSEINKFLSIEDAAPTVDIKEPRKGKKK